MTSNAMDLSPVELLTTTRAVRRRLDFERPVELDDVYASLRIAAQAPVGGGQERVNWVVVVSPAQRQAVADVYRAAGREHFRRRQEAAADDRSRRLYGDAIYLADNLHRVPVLVIACARGPLDRGANAQLAGFYGSVMPAIWSLQLALRLHGLASCWTTVHLRREAEMAALLSIPEDYTQIALLPVAHSTGKRFNPARRGPVEDVTHVDTWSAA